MRTLARSTMVVLCGAVGVAALLIGCAGPVALRRAMVPEDRAAYAAALGEGEFRPKESFLRWRAEERGITFAEAVRRDESLSATRNPFRANRDRRAVSLGAVVYATHCLRCHGERADGRGADVLASHPCKDFHAFDKRFAVTLHGGAPRTWFRKICDGYGDVVRYPEGESTAMPAFGETLSREQIWLAITYLQSLDVYVAPADSGGEG